MKATDFFVDGLSFLGIGPYSFYLAQGECLGLSGASGVGKTQLFRALSDLIPSSGNISFKGKNKDAVSAVTWRSQVTMLPTDSAWWYDDVSSHFPSKEERLFLVEMCAKVGLPQEIYHWQVSRLSTGEKQRLALLRTLQMKPAIIFVDEPTSALDAVNTQLIEMLLLDLCQKQNISLIWVSHDAAQLTRVSDRILYMDKTGMREEDDVLGKMNCEY